MQGGSTELFVGWFLERDGGDVFPHRLLTELGKLGLDLSLDIYPERHRPKPAASFNSGYL